MKTLYVVSTPIGNLGDITLRAIDVLKQVGVIACEDTRYTGLLLKKLQIETNPRLISLYEENEIKRIPEIVQLLKNGVDIAIVSNAGTPTISDPGFRLIRECVNQGILVIPIPGTCSITAALSSSGLPTDKFMFLGFLPKKPTHRVDLLEKVKKSLEILPSTVIFFESPYRVKATLTELKEIFGDINIVIAREMTKIYEEFIRDKISNLVEKYDQKKSKGEFVILFNLKEQ